MKREYHGRLTVRLQIAKPQLATPTETPDYFVTDDGHFAGEFYPLFR